MEWVSNLSYMFSGAANFNQPLNGWVTSNVTTLESTFQNASSFNQNLTPGASGRWDTAKVTNLANTFRGAIHFNNARPSGDPSVNMNWITANVTSMLYTFYDAHAFNSDIATWNTSKVTNFGGMFVNCYKFNQGVGVWDVSKATSIASMFYNAQEFNRDLSSWQTSNVTSMSRVFIGASKFNNGQTCNSGTAPMGGVVGFADRWNTSNVTDMSRMFEDAICFNQQLYFDTRKVTNMYNMFNNAKVYNQPMMPVDGPPDFYWNTGNVVNMKGMFKDASAFNQPIGAWDVSKVVNFNWTFYGATLFNQPLGSWVTTSATNMNGMFINASSFDQNISTWTPRVALVTDYEDFALGANVGWDPQTEQPLFAGAGIPDKKMYVTHWIYTGNLGGTAGADQLCMIDPDYPGTGVYKALLGSSSAPIRQVIPSEVDWVIRSLTQYTRPDGQTVVMSDLNKRLSAIYDVSIDSNYTGEYWLGLNQLWASSVNDCNGWTSGDPDSTATLGHTGSWTHSVGNCDVLRPILCVEQ